jgi:hypothetical protein
MDWIVDGLADWQDEKDDVCVMIDPKRELDPPKLIQGIL